MKLLLDGIWQMGKSDSVAIEARVPGSVYGNLLSNGLIDDPFWRDNEMKSLQICEDDYVFYRNFNVEAQLLQSDSIALVCEGIDTIADIIINNELIGYAENMHRTYTFDVKSLLKEEGNEIKIIIKSPTRYAREMYAKRAIWGVDGTYAGYQHIRKAHCMFGWDWGPILPDMGIWKSLYLTFQNTARIKDVHITQEHAVNEVCLNLNVSVECYKAEKLSLTAYIIYPSGYVETIEKAFKESSVTLQTTIKNPELWWPNGYGEQPLYRIELQLKGANLADSREYEIGLRTIRLCTSKDIWGREFTFAVNGVKIFAMGANYIPQDSFLMRVTPEKIENLIKDCIAANYNMLRVWGGGYYADDHFLNLCDRYGILVWQDFTFACALYALTDSLKENIRNEAIDNIKRMRHHASLALWCGNNEIETGLVHWGIPHNEKNRLDYLELFEHLLDEVVHTYDPERDYWPSSPSSFGGFERPGDYNCGDTHYWDVWHGMKPFEDYKNYYFRFCSEFGFQSFPAMKTIESFTLPEDRNIFSEVMEQHQKNRAANGKIIAYLADNYLYPKDLTQLIYASQLLQADAARFGVEHMRRFRGRCMGALYWQVNDCWPVASWASIDYFGRWKALHYVAKRFFAPVLLSCHEDDGNIKLNISNETRNEMSGSVLWRLKQNDGTILEKGNIQAYVSALSAKDLVFDFAVDSLSLEQRKKAYLEFSLLMEGKVVSSCTKLFVKPKHFVYLDPKISVDVQETEEQFVIVLSAQAFAQYVQVDFCNRDVVLSENFFDLSKDEVKRLIVNKKDMPFATKELLIQTIHINSVYDIAY